MKKGIVGCICILLCFCVCLGMPYNFTTVIGKISSFAQTVDTTLNKTNEFFGDTVLGNGDYVDDMDSTKIEIEGIINNEGFTYSEFIIECIKYFTPQFDYNGAGLSYLNYQVFEISYDGGTPYLALNFTMSGKQWQPFFDDKWTQADILWVLPYKVCVSGSKEFPYQSFVYMNIGPDDNVTMTTNIYEHVSDTQICPLYSASRLSWYAYNILDGIAMSYFDIDIKPCYDYTLDDVIKMMYDQYKILKGV